MKKAILYLLTAGIALSLTGCGGKNPDTASAGDMRTKAGADQGAGSTQGTAGAATGAQAAQGTGQDPTTAEYAHGKNEDKTEVNPASQTSGGLQLLATEGSQSSHTQNGYYYLTGETEELSNGDYGAHLMYMDFAALQEITLCSNTGCTHNTPDCPAVFPDDVFPAYTTLLFLWQDSLYFLGKQSDNDGSMQMSYSEDEPLTAPVVEGSSAVLYRENLDGTGREQVYAFDPSLTLEDRVMGDEKGFYFIAKKLTSRRGAEGTYIHSEERKLLFLDPKTGETEEICSLEFGDSISWRLAGCYGRTLVLEGTDYGRKVSDEEMFDDDMWKELYAKSREVFALLSIDNGSLTVKYQISNQEENSALIDGNLLYVSSGLDGKVRKVNLDTGEEAELAGLQTGSYYLYRKVGNKLCCQADLLKDTYDYIDVDTGGIQHSGLVNKSLGWSLEIKAVLDRDVLVVYDYEATALEGGSYEITRYQYGLISQEDLFAGKDNYRRVNMIGKGE